MNEQVLRFGEDQRMLGILALPALPALPARPDGGAADRPAVVFWNAGFLHRAGPYRAFVDTARRLTALGFPTFRFDVGGLGDSELAQDGRSDMERAVADIRAALDCMSEHAGIKRFVLMGLCSGADLAHPVALGDDRVAGLVMLDGYAYPTFGYWVRHVLFHYGRRALSLRKWKGKFRKWFGSRRNGSSRAASYERPFPPQEQARTELLSLLDGGVKTLFIYTGIAYFNHAGQFRGGFGSAVADHENLELVVFAKANHTYTLLDDRARMQETVDGWLVRRFAPPGSNAATPTTASRSAR